MKHRTKETPHVARDTAIYRRRRVALENVEQRVGTSLQTEVVHGFPIGITVSGKIVAAQVGNLDLIA